MDLWFGDVFYLLINVDLFFWTFVQQLIFLQGSFSFTLWSLLLGEIRIVGILILLNLGIRIIYWLFWSICIVNNSLFVDWVAIFCWIYLEFGWFISLFLRSRQLYWRLVWFWFIFLDDLTIERIISIIGVIFNLWRNSLWDNLC